MDPNESFGLVATAGVKRPIATSRDSDAGSVRVACASADACAAGRRPEALDSGGRLAAMRCRRVAAGLRRVESRGRAAVEVDAPEPTGCAPTALGASVLVVVGSVVVVGRGRVVVVVGRGRVVDVGVVGSGVVVGGVVGSGVVGSGVVGSGVVVGSGGSGGFASAGCDKKAATTSARTIPIAVATLTPARARRGPQDL